MKKITGPFTQILPLTNLPLKGRLKDDQLQIIQGAWILLNKGRVVTIGTVERLKKDHPSAQIEEVAGNYVVLPGFVDCHTHLCFGGTRVKDYALRQQGKTYQEIAGAGGGIWDTVKHTTAADEATLTNLLLKRIERHLSEGVTTIEVKSGYGLTVEEELKQLRAIKAASFNTKAAVIPTCLAAHMVPKEFIEKPGDYLEIILSDLLPVIRKEALASRIDIFIDNHAFRASDAKEYLTKAKEMGFDITVHADQFTTGGSEIALEVGAVSADHLEASKDRDIKQIAKSNTVAVTLPGASMGLGMKYAPARKLLDAGACVAIASDWNPGSAPMGDLLMQAAVMGAAEKLSTAEVFAGLTFRAAKALNLTDRGTLATGGHGVQAFPCADYREILYNQGKLKGRVIS